MAHEKESSEMALSASRVLYRLAELELNGVQFYEGVMIGTSSQWVRRLADMLVRAEKRHYSRFMKYAVMALKIEMETDGYQPLTPKLSDLLNTQVFASKERVEKSIKFAGDRDVLNVAIRAEENIAMLMTELCEYVPRNQRIYIKRVIKEEWGHKASLEEVLRKHFGGR